MKQVVDLPLILLQVSNTYVAIVQIHIYTHVYMHKAIYIHMHKMYTHEIHIYTHAPT